MSDDAHRQLTTKECKINSFVDVLALDVRVLIVILGDAPVVVSVLPLSQQLREVHVVGDDDELKVLLVVVAQKVFPCRKQNIGLKIKFGASKTNG